MKLWSSFNGVHLCRPYQSAVPEVQNIKSAALVDKHFQEVKNGAQFK